MIGRFLQRDPVGYDDSMNLYQYVYNNPTNHIDPSGKTGEELLLAAPFLDGPLPIGDVIAIAGGAYLLAKHYLARNGLNAGAAYPPLKQVGGVPSVESLGYFPNFKFNRPPKNNGPQRGTLFKIGGSLFALRTIQKIMGIDKGFNQERENNLLNNNSTINNTCPTSSGFNPFKNGFNLFRHPTVPYTIDRA